MFRFKFLTLLLVFSHPLFAELTKENQNFVLKITVTGFIIVLLALTVVYFFVLTINAIIRLAFEYSKNRADRKTAEEENREKTEGKGAIPEEMATAIMTAVYLFRRQNLEEEKAKLTFERWAKPYSPWSSKIYGLRQPIVTIKRAGK